MSRPNTNTMQTPVLIEIMVTFLCYTALATSDNITIIANTTVDFFFGPRVVIPDDNLLIDDEQCFEIGLDCTVLDLPSLVQSQVIRFEAYVETDNGVKTRRRRISLEVSSQ